MSFCMATILFLVPVLGYHTLTMARIGLEEYYYNGLSIGVQMYRLLTHNPKDNTNHYLTRDVCVHGAILTALST